MGDLKDGRYCKNLTKRYLDGDRTAYKEIDKLIFNIYSSMGIILGTNNKDDYMQNGHLKVTKALKDNLVHYDKFLGFIKTVVSHSAKNEFTKSNRQKRTTKLAGQASKTDAHPIYACNKKKCWRYGKFEYADNCKKCLESRKEYYGNFKVKNAQYRDYEKKQGIRSKEHRRTVSLDGMLERREEGTLHPEEKKILDNIESAQGFEDVLISELYTEEALNQLPEKQRKAVIKKMNGETLTNRDRNALNEVRKKLKNNTTER